MLLTVSILSCNGNRRISMLFGSVKTIRTCYPQTSNGGASATSKPGKMDMFLGNKVVFRLF